MQILKKAGHMAIEGIVYIASFFLYLYKQARSFGKTLHKKGLCRHFKNIELFTYLGGTPTEHCNACEKYFGFDFINDRWREKSIA